MISNFITVNPALPYKEKDELLWRRYMQSHGWNFIDDGADLPKHPVLFGTGDRGEFLEVYGFNDDNKWIAQNYPYGHIEVEEEVIAWREPITNLTYDDVSFQTTVGNDFLTRACSTIATIE